MVPGSKLHKLLADERKRNQLHRNNYEQLKEEHTQLQDRYRDIEEEFKRTIEESKLVKEKYRNMYEESRRAIIELQSMVDEQRTEGLSAHKLDHIKMQMKEEIESAHREKFQKQELEVDEFRNTCSELKYELLFLKAKNDREVTESTRALQEIQIQYDVEVSDLRKDRENTVCKLQAVRNYDSMRTRVLQRENLQLSLKIKGLNTEVNDVRTEREKTVSELESQVRGHSRRIMEIQSVNKSLQGKIDDISSREHYVRCSLDEISADLTLKHTNILYVIQTERDSLRQQMDGLSRDLTAATDTHTKLSNNIHELEKENMVYRNRVAEMSHKSELDISNLKLEMLKQNGNLERDRDKLSNTVEDLNVKLEIQSHIICQQNQSLIDKERETVWKIQSVREEEFKKVASLENEKIEFETKLQETGRRQFEEDAFRATENERLEDRINDAVDAKEAAEKELLVIRSHLSRHQAIMDQLIRERNENTILRDKILEQETEISSYNHDMADETIRMRNAIEHLTKELNLTKDQRNKVLVNNENISTHSKKVLGDEKITSECCVYELEKLLTDVTNKYAKAVTAYKKVHI